MYSNLTDEQLLNMKNELEAKVAQYHNKQLAKKIQMNSCYGALANRYMRWFDTRLAESITKSGQLSIRWMEKHMNIYINKLVGTTDIDYVIACDTDSMYLNLNPLVKMVFKDKSATDQEITEFLDQACKTQIVPFIDKTYDRLGQYMNVFKQKMKMKRESIGSSCIWVGRKHYAINLYDEEGVRFKEPKMKMVGIEAVKSSTPEPCKKFMKDGLKVILDPKGTEKQLQASIREASKVFESLPFEEIAAPKTCNNLTKYADNVTIFSKGTPIHVRGALVYNHMVKELNLPKTQLINEGDKIKYIYLKMPNFAKTNVISCPGILPRELRLEEDIDYQTQFEKLCLSFLTSASHLRGWQPIHKPTLSGFLKRYD